jgi:hypothetical protein
MKIEISKFIDFGKEILRTAYVVTTWTGKPKLAKKGWKNGKTK